VEPATPRYNPATTLYTPHAAPVKQPIHACPSFNLQSTACTCLPAPHTQLAKLAGCHVIATAGGPSKVQLLKKLGADRVIDYKSERLKVRGAWV
jgi:hypothetical protein